MWSMDHGHSEFHIERVGEIFADDLVRNNQFEESVDFIGVM